MHHVGYDAAKKFNRIYDNTLPSYQLYVRRHELRSLAQLTILAMEYESIQERNILATPIPPRQPPRYTRPMAQRAQNEGETNRAQFRKTHWNVPEPARVPHLVGAPVQEATQPPLQVQDGRIVARVTIGARCTDATVDTGASRSFINADLARQLDHNNDLREACVQILLADGCAREITQILLARVRLDERKVQMPLLVLSNMLEQVIVKMDFLCATDTMIQCGTTRLFHQGHQRPVSNTPMITACQVHTPGPMNSRPPPPTNPPIRNETQAQETRNTKPTAAMRRTSPTPINQKSSKATKKASRSSEATDAAPPTKEKE
ncbi:uncharacterized protein LOC117191816 [Drosophila miranda]|uniref:uncharacterized protein LOC117191816 n=1 Tax=Drosophila miranda TaxID=7229 RepID=UPI00143FA9A5|nr:uncharacterized protein LOC117191816 [Drosophila miranda]XP_033252472.1 uncharacterized protein LOC117191816 [Drosophila miranda]